MLDNLTLIDYILIGLVVCQLLRKLFKELGFDAAAEIADKIGGAMADAKDTLAKSDGRLVNINSVADLAAAQIKGVTADDLKPLLVELANNGSAKIKGVKVDIGTDGTVRADFTGAASKLAHKLSAFLKKVF